MLANKSVLLVASRALPAVLAGSTRSSTKAAVATAEYEWEKGSMVFKDSMEDNDEAYIKASSANGFMMEGALLTDEADYLSEARVDYAYKGPCDSTSSLQLNSATQFMLDNCGHSQPVATHCATIGGHVPQAANLAGTGLSHLHFKGSSGGLGCKFLANNLLAVHPSRQLHSSAPARQQGVQDGGGLELESAGAAPEVTAQGIQGEADSAQARLWVSRCLGDGLYTDCSVPPEAAGRRRKTVQQLFVQMLVDIRAAAERHFNDKK